MYHHSSHLQQACESAIFNNIFLKHVVYVQFGQVALWVESVVLQLRMLPEEGTASV